MNRIQSFSLDHSPAIVLGRDATAQFILSMRRAGYRVKRVTNGFRLSDMHHVFLLCSPDSI